MMMAHWDQLPSELLQLVFNSLSHRYDQLSFSCVCTNWRITVDLAPCWTHLHVEVDQDLNEPYLIFLLQRYCQHLKELEIGWSVPKEPEKYFYRDMVKRVARLLVLLYERRVQLKKLVIFNWNDLYLLKKLCYLLMRFVKIQSQLKSVTLINANLHDMAFTNILMSCLKSNATITHIRLHYSTYVSKRLFDGWAFTNCMDLFYNLEVLTIDCWIFLQFFSKICTLQTRICKLKELNLYLDDTLKKADDLITVRQSQWEMFFVYLPRAVVNLKVEHPMGDEQFRKIIHKQYALKSFDWNYLGFTERCEADSCQCLERLVKLQKGSIENIRLTLPISQSALVKPLKLIRTNCLKMKSLIFNNKTL